MSMENYFRYKTSLKLTFVLAPVPKATVMDIEVASSTPISLFLGATSIYTSLPSPCQHSPCFFEETVVLYNGGEACDSYLE